MSILNKAGLGALLALSTLVVSSAALAADAQGGMVVVKDAQTNQLRAPTPEEAQAMAAAEKGKTKAVGMISGKETPMTLVKNNGTVMLELTEDSLVYSVVKRGADGKLDMHCVTGKDAANKAVNSKTTTTEEHKHDK